MPTDQLPDPGFKVITIIVHEDGSNVYDLGGVNPWAANNILIATANCVWSELPEPSNESVE